MEYMEFLPEAYVENEKLRNIIIEEINSLSQQQETCLSYYYLHDFSPKDIVEVTGLRLKQVVNALKSGLQTLKNILEQRFGENFVFSVAPVGTTSALARIFEARRDEMVPVEWCEEVFNKVLDRLNGMVPKGCTAAVNVVMCTIAKETADPAFYIYYPN